MGIFFSFLFFIPLELEHPEIWISQHFPPGNSKIGNIQCWIFHSNGNWELFSFFKNQMNEIKADPSGFSIDFFSPLGSTLVQRGEIWLFLAQKLVPKPHLKGTEIQGEKFFPFWEKKSLNSLQKLQNWPQIFFSFLGNKSFNFPQKLQNWPQHFSFLGKKKSFKFSSEIGNWLWNFSFLGKKMLQILPKTLSTGLKFFSFLGKKCFKFPQETSELALKFFYFLGKTKLQILLKNLRTGSEIFPFCEKNSLNSPKKLQNWPQNFPFLWKKYFKFPQILPVPFPTPLEFSWQHPEERGKPKNSNCKVKKINKKPKFSSWEMLQH